MGGGGGDDAAPADSSPATTESAAPAPVEAAAAAVPAEPAAPKEPDPVPPWVEAAEERKKIPIWAVPVLALLPLWAVVYALTLDTPTPTEPGAFEEGAIVYADMGCQGCHGATGGGAGAVPALNASSDLLEVFPEPAQQVTWVALGTEGYRALGLDSYGEGKAMGTGNMPGWMDTLSAEELMTVVLHERSVLSDEEFDVAAWAEGFEETLAEKLPEDKVAEYVEVLHEWEADPPEAP
jgi:mono/diheme cytochrome c family protein